jgi:adenine deaminase
MATINTAEYFGLSRVIGSIAPGRYADMVLVSSLETFKAELVIAKGKVAALEGRMVIDLPTQTYPEWVLNSVHIPRLMKAADFCLPARIQQGQALAHVIGVIENQAPNRHLRIPVAVNGGEVRPDPARDLAKIALVERHRSTGNVTVGLVQGFGFNVPCAVATTVAHDSHNMIVVGTSEEDMAAAVNALEEWGGGQVVVREGKIIGKVELPIAGLMSNEPATIVAEHAATVLAGFKTCGCNLNNPNMQLSLMGLVVIPELRISDLGLVDVNRFDFISVLESE